MMRYAQGEGLWLPRFVYTSHNQHGQNFHKVGEVGPLAVLRLEVDLCNPSGNELKHLILLGSQLESPVRWDAFPKEGKQQTAYIELVSAEALREARDKICQWEREER